jgi:pSer/pThr/pTyr-binding forkhead associated (FHA) protein
MEGKITIENMGYNGTFVNGERLVVKRPIAHGSVVTLCATNSAASFTFFDSSLATAISDLNDHLNQIQI